MALKKSELYSSLWESCDELRGGMDASQYKDYVLVLLFVKYVSDKYAGVPFAPITIPEGASFADMVALKNACRSWSAISTLGGNQTRSYAKPKTEIDHPAESATIRIFGRGRLWVSQPPHPLRAIFGFSS